jgi:ComF family protein
MLRLAHLKKMIQAIKQGLNYFIFAPECLECRTLLQGNQHYFCHSCVSLFELLNPHERCEHCFKELSNTTFRICPDCLKSTCELKKVASACEYLGPPATMIRLMKYGNQPELAITAAAYMALQWVELGWPQPDYIVPVPCTWLRRFDRGYNQAELIAKELGVMLGVPIFKNLKRRLGDLSQAGLSREQRLKQPLDSFYVKKDDSLEDKSILLVDDVMTTGKTLNVCAEILQECYPKEIYGLTFCRAVD